MWKRNNFPHIESSTNVKTKEKRSFKKRIISICSLGAIILLIMGFFGVFDKPAHDITDGAYGYGDINSSDIKEDEIPTDAQGTSGKMNIDSPVDLYELRFVTEEVLIDNLGFVKNEYGTYPSENDLIFTCIDGIVYTITLTEDDIGKYSFLGVSAGDYIEDAQKKIVNFFTLIETTTAAGGLFRDIYKDNEYGLLMLNYNMSSYEIESISYVAEKLEENEYSAQESETQEIIDSQEFTYWDETREDLVTIDYISDEAGYITFDLVKYADEWSEREERLYLSMSLKQGTGTNRLERL